MAEEKEGFCKEVKIVKNWIGDLGDGRSTRTYRPTEESPVTFTDERLYNDCLARGCGVDYDEWQKAQEAECQDETTEETKGESSGSSGDAQSADGSKNNDSQGSGDAPKASQTPAQKSAKRPKTRTKTAKKAPKKPAKSKGAAPENKAMTGPGSDKTGEA